MIVLQKQKDRYIQFKVIPRYNVDLEKKLKALEANFSKNGSENNHNFYRRNLFKTTKKELPTNKTDVYHIDGIWSLDILDLKDYGSENNRGFRYLLVVIHSFTKFSWTIHLKDENAQTMKDSFENVFFNFKNKTNFDQI